MTKYIDLDVAISIIEEKQKALCPVGLYGRSYVYGSDREKYNAWDEIIDSLEAVPIADVAPATHGQWKLENTMDCSEDKLYCSECKYVAWVGRGAYKGRTPFCPNCGAKMDKGD